MLATGHLLLTAGAAYAQQREIILQGTYNFRDIGGYQTQEGKQIKWGKIYRSAVLSNLTIEDLQLLEVLKIKTVIDFRGPKETAVFPDKIPNNARYVQLAAGSKNDEPDDWAAMAEDMKTKSELETDREALTYYKNIKSFGKRYKPMFDELLKLSPDSSIVFHCAGGKDRTGLAAALIEYVLGVSKQQILEDYVITNQYRKRYNEAITELLHLKYGVPQPRAALYGLAKPEFLEASFRQIEQQYGSLDRFVQTELGLDKEKIEQLKKLYLEDRDG